MQVKSQGEIVSQRLQIFDGVLFVNASNCLADAWADVIKHLQVSSGVAVALNRDVSVRVYDSIGVLIRLREYEPGVRQTSKHPFSKQSCMSIPSPIENSLEYKFQGDGSSILLYVLFNRVELPDQINL